MNCLGLVHHDAKLVAGCGDGRLYMFNWGEFGLHNADFPGHPDAINHLVSHYLFQLLSTSSVKNLTIYFHSLLRRWP